MAALWAIQPLTAGPAFGAALLVVDPFGDVSQLARERFRLRVSFAQE